MRVYQAIIFILFSAITAVSVERILTMARTRRSCCALLVKMRSTLTAVIAVLFFTLFSFPLYADELIIEPEMGRQPIIHAIDNAHQSIQIVMYGFTDKSLLEKLIQQKRNGRTINIILEEKPYQTEAENNKTFSILKHEAIPFIANIPSLRLIHQKTLIIDKQKALVMTFNFTHAAFKRERNFALIVDDPQRVNAIENIFSADWHNTPVLNPSAQILLSPEDSRQKLLSFIAQAKYTLQIYAQNINDYKIIGALAKAARKGIHVQLLSSTNLREKEAHYLIRAGVKISYTKKLIIHAKVIILDNEKALIGSINLTRASLDDNRELSVITEDTHVIKSLTKTFNHDWNDAEAANKLSLYTDKKLKPVRPEERS
ncbi:MAG: hypothetical protein JO149_00320 [Gammaproteobacteria bacterium]|nr:hypothetical protein [Gammaproteobacteria bacterium]